MVISGIIFALLIFYVLKNNTLSLLKKTNLLLIQSEKMAALGQLAAGIAHEVNTPLGAIKSSNEESAHAFKDLLVDYIWLAKTLNEKDKDMFMDFVNNHKPNIEAISTKEERVIKNAMREKFAVLGVENSHFLSDRLVQVGIYEVNPALEKLSKLKDFEKLVMILYNIYNQQRGNHTVQLAVDKASRIVKALKTYLHTSNNEEMETVNIRDNMETVLTIYQNRLKQGIQVIKNYGEVPDVIGFPDKLNQVWTNLIVNAVQAMNNVGVLTIGIEKEGDHVLVSIKDTGMGISKENQEKIFTPFFTTKISGEGSGLGLDIIKRILNEHKASITFESNEGLGTVFYVKLPIYKTKQKNEKNS